MRKSEQKGSVVRNTSHLKELGIYEVSGLLGRMTGIEGESLDEVVPTHQVARRDRHAFGSGGTMLNVGMQLPTVDVSDQHKISSNSMSASLVSPSRAVNQGRYKVCASTQSAHATRLGTNRNKGARVALEGEAHEHG